MKLKNTQTGLMLLLATFSLASSISLIAQSASKDGTTSGDLGENENEDVVVLTPFTVSTTANTGYGAMQASSGRLGELYIDTPQATSIITSEIMKDAKLDSSYNALKFVANATQTQSGHNPDIIRATTSVVLVLEKFSTMGLVLAETRLWTRHFLIELKLSRGQLRPAMDAVIQRAL